MKRPEKPYCDRYFIEYILGSGCIYVRLRDDIEDDVLLRRIFVDSLLVSAGKFDVSANNKKTGLAVEPIKGIGEVECQKFESMLVDGCDREFLFRMVDVDIAEYVKMEFGQWMLIGTPKATVPKAFVKLINDYMEEYKTGIVIYLSRRKSVETGLFKIKPAIVFFGVDIVEESAIRFPSRERWLIETSPLVRACEPEARFMSERDSVEAARKALKLDSKFHRLMPFSRYAIEEL